MSEFRRKFCYGKKAGYRFTGWDKPLTNIKKDINQIDGVLGSFDLILNSYGYNKSIGSVHIGVSSKLSAREIQVIERDIAAMMYQKYNPVMTVGIYADYIETETAKAIHNAINNIIKDYKNVLQLHGFFVDEDKKLCNFDLVFSFDEKEPEEAIEEIKTKLQTQFTDYCFIINLDKDYSLS